jgi:hypothetical protein
VHYTPAAGYSGPDSFGYSVKNNSVPACQGQATCSITVCATTAVNDSATVCAGSSVDIAVLANDTTTCGAIDCTTLAIVSPPAHGTASIQGCSGNCTGCVVQYTPAAGYTGPDSFSYSVMNNSVPACQGQATCSITVCATNAVNDTATVSSGGSVNIAVLANDTTTCGAIDCTTLAIVSPPAHGTASIQGCSGNCTGCVVQYTSAAGYSGPDSFTYSVANDSTPSCTSTATCNITVTRPSPGTAFCFGDGLDPNVHVSCPCANTGGQGHGCANSQNMNGAVLTAAGTTSPDTVVMTSSGELPSSLSVLLQGNVNASSGVVFGDGIRCASGNLKRLYTKNASGGVVSMPGAGDPSITTRSAQLGDTILPGTNRYYQTYYRDPNLTFCAPGFNASNAMQITW